MLNFAHFLGKENANHKIIEESCLGTFIQNVIEKDAVQNQIGTVQNQIDLLNYQRTSWTLLTMLAIDWNMQRRAPRAKRKKAAESMRETLYSVNA